MGANHKNCVGILREACLTVETSINGSTFVKQLPTYLDLPQRCWKCRIMWTKYKQWHARWWERASLHYRAAAAALAFLGLIGRFNSCASREVHLLRLLCSSYNGRLWRMSLRHGRVSRQGVECGTTESQLSQVPTDSLTT